MQRVSPSWRGVVSGLVVAGCFALAACAGDAPETSTPSSEAASPEARLRRGLVRVSDEELPAFALDWRAPPVTVNEANVSALHATAAKALARGHLLEDGEAAIPVYLALLQHDASDQRAQKGLTDALVALRKEGDAALARAARGEPWEAAHQVGAVLRTIAGGSDSTLRFLTRVDAQDRLDALLAHGWEQWRAGELGEKELGALAAFREVSRARPRDPNARDGLDAVESAMLQRAAQAALALQFDEAETWLQHAKGVYPNGSEAQQAAVMAVAFAREERITVLQKALAGALKSGNVFAQLPKAELWVNELVRIAAPDDARVAFAQSELARARRYGAFARGQVFTDVLASGLRGPQMVVLPNGRFLQGAPANEPGSSKAEWPQHEVTFDRGFAMARTEVTVDQFRAFVKATGYVSRSVRREISTVYDERSGNFVLRTGIHWEHDYSGRLAAGNLPVIHVDANDAQAYADWLSGETGTRYRVPSEAEFEYALRAGRQALYPWGDGPPRAGNLTGALDRSPTGRRWGNAFEGYGDGAWGPARVGRYQANAFGLHDLAGNVSEWTADCWHQGYRRAPADGRVWFNPGCRARVVRGGSWSSAPAYSRAAWRTSSPHDVTNARTGFRVVRDL